MSPPIKDPLLRPSEVAAMWSVCASTIARWRKAGLITPVKMPSGHFRYKESHIRALLEGDGEGAA